MKVTEIDKPSRQPCQHLCEHGCSIYSTRPNSCQTFECLWLTGWIGNDDYRPDKFGLMLTTNMVNGEVILNAWEVESNDKQDYFLKKLSKKIVVILRQIGGATKLYGTPSQIQAFMRRHKSNESQ